MEAEVKTVICPNCGARTHNLHNCDFCGSLLVRYTDNGQVVDETVFGNNVNVIPGLIEELKNNLSLQEIRGDNQIVVTTIRDNTYNTWVQVIESDKCNYGTTAPVSPFPSAPLPSVALRLVFEIRSDDPNEAAFERQRLASFKQASYFFMFTPQNHITGVYYYLDFGFDAENAAKILTSILCMEDSVFTFETVLAEEKDSKNVSGLLVDNGKKKRNTIGLVVGIIIIIIIYLLS